MPVLNVIPKAGRNTEWQKMRPVLRSNYKKPNEFKNMSTP